MMSEQTTDLAKRPNPVFILGGQGDHKYLHKFHINPLDLLVKLGNCVP
jgi:hypothetical protein